MGGKYLTTLAIEKQRIAFDFSETMHAGKIFKVVRGKKNQPRILYSEIILRK